MKQIVNNKYLKSFKFSTFDEASSFFKNQKTEKSLSIEDTFGDNYYCYVCYSSLTSVKQFVLFFSSDENEDNLSFLFWNKLFVLDTGKNIFLIDESINIVSSIDVTTPLIGLHLINNENLLVLEEAFMRVINYKGVIVKSELFDLIEDFSIKNNLLSIQTGEGNKVIKLI